MMRYYVNFCRKIHSYWHDSLILQIPHDPLTFIFQVTFSFGPKIVILVFHDKLITHLLSKLGKQLDARSQDTSKYLWLYFLYWEPKIKFLYMDVHTSSCTFYNNDWNTYYQFVAANEDLESTATPQTTFSLITAPHCNVMNSHNVSSPLPHFRTLLIRADLQDEKGKIKKVWT